MESNFGSLVMCYTYSVDGRIIGSRVGIIMEEIKVQRSVSNIGSQALYEILIDGVIELLPRTDFRLLEQG